MLNPDVLHQEQLHELGFVLLGEHERRLDVKGTLGGINSNYHLVKDTHYHALFESENGQDLGCRLHQLELVKPAPALMWSKTVSSSSSKEELNQCAGLPEGSLVVLIRLVDVEAAP